MFKLLVGGKRSHNTVMTVWVSSAIEKDYNQNLKYLFLNTTFQNILIDTKSQVK